MNNSNVKEPTRFVAYVDESGDEGFVFNPDGSGSSRWFMLSAVVTRRFNDLQMVECLRETRGVLGKAPKTPLHFADLKHEQRVPYIRRVGSLDIRTVNIAVYKPSIREVSRFQGTKHLLYRYTTRFLVERLSWMLSRTGRGRQDQDRSAEIIFSDRANMSYEEIRSYLGRLIRQSKSTSSGVQIDGSVIDPAQVRSVQHSQMAGLQVADAVATSTHFALRPNRYGETESAYFRHLARTLYRHEGKVLSYGMKFWPGEYEALKSKIPQIEDLEDFLH